MFATPMMLALMERACCECLTGVLDAGQTSVGISASIKHTAASLPGAEISAAATVIGIDGRLIEFEVTASDPKGEIGRGTHERFIVDEERFLSRTMKRLS